MQWPIAALFEEQRNALTKIHPDLHAFFVQIDNGRGQLVPFLPIGTFRRFHIFSKKHAYRTFLSSGSTNEVRAQHSFSKEGFKRYEEDSARNFGAFLDSLRLPRDVPIISLIPRASEWPQSSLAAMIEMFRRQEFSVVYSDEVTQFQSTHVIIFGTSFHHMLFLQDPHMCELAAKVNGRHVTVIDTGGTKGRTRSYSLEEVHEVIQRNFVGAASCKVVSEYGMCELSSQAWSLHSPHDGWFKTNDTLTPLILDLDDRAIIGEDECIGFLAFLDANNQDSYSGIITEDLAVMNRKYPGCFKLVGRAPDASIKGCSLNVKANFTQTSLASSLQIDAEYCPHTMEDMVRELADDVWDVYSKGDLLRALKTLPSGGGNFERTRIGQRVLMVLSANIPITFLYPAFMLLARGAKELHLQLPSLRPFDPYSERVRRQIETLAKALAPLLRPISLFIRSGKDLSLSSLNEFDAVIVFGSDDTLRTFRSALPESGGTELIALGNVTNAYVLKEKDTPGGVAEICSHWMGRGCLTPVAIVGDEIRNEFVHEFATEFENAFSKRLAAAGVANPFAHRHRIIEMESLLKSLGAHEDARVIRNRNTFIFDLRGLQLDSRFDIALKEGGCGLVLFMSREQSQEFKVQNFPHAPSFAEPHTTKTWHEWI